MSFCDGPLIHEYTITAKDGQPVPPGRSYLVLDLSTPDERERATLVAMVTACERYGYTRLADEPKATCHPPSLIPALLACTL